MGIDASVLAAFVTPKHAIIIVLLYVVGIGLRKYKSLKNNFIPLILTFLSFVLCSLLTLSDSPVPVTFQTTMGMIYNVIIQSFICVAASVYFNQIGKQLIRLNTPNKPTEEETKDVTDNTPDNMS